MESIACNAKRTIIARFDAGENLLLSRRSGDIRRQRRSSFGESPGVGGEPIAASGA